MATREGSHPLETLPIDSESIPRAHHAIGLTVQLPYGRAEGPLNLLVDTTGIKFFGDCEWQASAAICA